VIDFNQIQAMFMQQHEDMGDTSEEGVLSAQKHAEEILGVDSLELARWCDGYAVSAIKTARREGFSSRDMLASCMMRTFLLGIALGRSTAPQEEEVST
jgi:hypothetical protein